MPLNLEMFIFCSPYCIRTANAYLSEIMAMLWCNQTEKFAGIKAPFTTFPQMSWSRYRVAVAPCLGPSTVGADKCSLLVCAFDHLVSIFALSVVIIMCGSTADVGTDLGMEEVDRDIVIILIDLFK